MATCPNKSSREWKTLVSAQGEDSAYYLWDKYNGEVPESFNTSLDERLINGFLKDFSITATEYNDLKEDLGIDSYSASDLVSKAIAYKKGQTITPEVAYFAYSMLGRKNNKIKSSLKYLINKWSKYQEKFDYYTEIIKEKEGFISDKREWQQKVRELVIIDFLKENIEDYYKNPVEFEKSLDTRWVRGIDKFKSDDFTLWESIIKFFEEALSIFSNKHKQKTEQLSNLGLAIADEILNNNYEYFNYDLAEGQIQKFYKQTIESDPFAKSLVEFGQKTLGMVLTGSLALRRAGQVFRTAYETLHDIDWVVPYSLSGSAKNKEVLDSIYNIQNKYKKEVLELNPGSPSYQNNLTELEEKLTKECLNEIKNFDWYKKFQEKYPNFELLGGFYGGEHGDLESFTVQGVIDPERYDSLGSHKETWTAYSKDPKTKAPIAEKREILVPHLKGDIIKDTGYVIDFFVRLQENQEEHENYFKLWKEIMIAKLKMGRDKDFIDWKAFVPYVKSQDSFNFNYEGFRHFNYTSSERNALEEEETKSSFQLEGMPMSEASEETLTVVRELLKKMGVKIESLLEYAKTSKLDLKNVNALADTIKGIIAVAEGKEGAALTEEMVHIATAILEAKYPKMVTEMIAKIDRFKVYNITLKAYKGNPEYQLPNGKPDIRKIKKEAVDKLIAELIVNGGSDVAQYPELLEEENINFVQRIWNKVLDWFRGQYKESNIDIFKQTATTILNDEIGGTVTDIQNKDVYFQVLSAPQEVIQKELLGRQAKIKKVESGEKVDPMFMDTEEASNWYEMQNAEGVWGKIEKRVTDRVKAWYRQRFGNKTFTKQEQAFNEFKRKFGVKAHGWFEDIHGRYFNSDGTRKTSIDKRKITLSQTEEDMYSQLEKYFTDLVAKFSENGKTPLVFSEIMLYDPKEKEAGTLDLVIVDETGKANIFDWKFMSVSQEAEDIAWYKQGAYNIQLGRYKEMLRDSYGIKEFGMNRAIPIIMDIKTPSSMNLNADPVVTGIAIGSVNPSEIKELKLIPVSEETESTGFDTLDTLIKDLNIVYRQISKTNVSDEEEKQFKSKRLNSIKKAIRAAQGSLNIAPLVEVIREMRISGQMIIDDYTNTYANRPAASDDINNRELSDFSDEMREYLAFAEVFGRVDDRIKNLIYTSEMDAEAKTEEEKEAVSLRKDLLESIREETSKIREHQDNVKKISGKFADKFIGQRNLVTGLLNAEAVLKGLGALFNGVSDLPLASLKILYKLVNNAKGVAAKIANDEVEELMAIRKRLTDRGGNTRELIKQIYQKDDKDKWVNKLIYKYNKDFYTFIDKNAESGNRDKAWLRDSIDVEAYKKEALQKMNENISYYERRYADDPDLLEQVVYEETLKWDIDNPDFNGWNNYVIKRHPQEKWQSEEYIKLTKDKDLLALYEFISKINLKAKSVGYIQNAVASTFLPFIRKSMAESLAWDASLSAITSLGDRLSIGAEDVGYGSINELTKELEHGIPKYYTHDFSKAEDGTHDYSDVSEDLFKNMIMYINHMEKYSMLSEIEGQLQLVKTIEAAKDHLNTSQTGDIIIENGSPKELAGNKENTQMFDDFLRGLLYEQKYPLSDSDTPLNINVKNAVKKAINKIAGRVVYTPEENPSATSLVKSIDAMNRAFQLKTLGFEVLSGAVNAFGANIQVATQAGNYFKAREVLANENKLLGNRFKNDDERNMFIQLVETFMPLKDDPTYDKLKEAGLTKLTQGSFSDFLMMFMRQPEQHMEKSIFLTLLDNTMVEDGKLVNIREFVKNKYKDRYSEGAAKAREIDNKIDSEIAELKKTRSISVTKKLVDGKLEVPGLDLNNIKEVQRLTNLTRRIARNATGGMADSDLNRASMNIWLKSMMVFKGWIPKLLKTRFSELAEVSDDFSTEIDEDGMTIGQKYDIGRIRLFGHVLGDGIIQGATNIHNIIVLNDAGLARLDKMYEDFAASYEKRTGKVFQMDKADFIDLMRNNLRNQIKELAILMSLFGMALSLGFFEPEDDEDKATKNFYRFSQRTIDKFVGELSFFYNPVEFQKLLSGSAFPALGIFSDIERFTSHFFMETTGLDLSDTDLTSEEVRKKAQPIKHFSKMLPITKSMITYLSIFDSDFAKEFDITIQKESRR